MAFALVLVLALVLPGLTSTNSVLSAPKANAQAEEIIAQNNQVSVEPFVDQIHSVPYTEFKLPIGQQSTVTKIVLNHDKLQKNGKPYLPAISITVGGQTYRASDPNSVKSDFTSKQWTFTLLSAPQVGQGGNVSFTSTLPASSFPSIGMTVYGQKLATQNEVTPAAPTLVEASECGVQKTVTIPQVAGVKYDRQDSGDTVIVTAQPQSADYVFPAGAQTRWEFNIAAQPCPTEPDSENANLTVNGIGGVELKDIRTTGSGNGPYTTTATTTGKSTFEKAVVRLEKPAQQFNTKSFNFTATALADGATIGTKVNRNDLGYLEVEFYPMINGRRAGSIDVADNNVFTLTSNFDFDPSGATITAEIHGTKTEEPQPETAALPQSDMTCGQVDGVTHLKKWWQTGTNNSGATQNVSELRIKLTNPSQFNTNDPGFRVQYGNTSNGVGFMNLSNGLDFTVTADDNAGLLIIKFNNPLQAPPHEYSDFHVFLPKVNPGTCDGDLLTIWGVDKDNPDTGTPWREDTGTLGSDADKSPTIGASSTGIDGYVHLLNSSAVCRGRSIIDTLWSNLERNDPNYVYPKGDLSMIAIELGKQVRKVSDYKKLTVQVYAGRDVSNSAIRKGPGDYTLEIDGTRLFIKFNAPIKDNDASRRLVRVNLGKNLNSCVGVDGVKLYRKSVEKPEKCEPGKPVTDPKGNLLAAMGQGGAVVKRLPARALTEQERIDGHRVYVTASEPQTQSRDRTQLYYQPQASGDFVKIGGETGWVVNSLAYNPRDNWLYAISQGRIGNNQVVSDVVTRPDGQITDHKREYVTLEDPCFPAGHLLQIDPVTGEVHNLGRVTKPNSEDYAFAGEYDQPWANDLWGGINNGFIDDNGDFWVSNSSTSGSGALYKVNLDRVTGAARYGDTGKHSDLKTGYRTEDMTTLPKKVQGEKYSGGNFAWGIVNQWVSGGSVVKLMRVDLRNGNKQEFDVTGLRAPTGQAIPTGHQWGKAWTYGNADLGFGTSSTGANSTGVRIKVTDPDSANPKFELVTVESSIPSSYNSNGTSNGSADIRTDLKVTKEFLGIDDAVAPQRLKWRVTVSNLGLDGSSGFVLNDKLPTGLSDIKVDNNPANARVSIGNGSLQAIFGSLCRNQNVSIEFSAAANSNEPAVCIPNTVTVAGNEADPDLDNNTSTADCSEGNPDIKIRLQKVDFEDNAVKLDATFALYDTALGADGKLQPTGEGIELRTENGGLSGEAAVQAGKTYFLVETKSPEGYSLLPQPILLVVTRGADGKAHIEFQDQKNGFPATLVNPGGGADGGTGADGGASAGSGADSDVVTIQIADVSIGELPKTGGVGVGLITLLGFVIVASGAAVARRRNGAEG